MTIDLYINEANDYARDIGAPVYHPHVSVIHYDEVGEIRHTLNRTNCYAIFLQQEFLQINQKYDQKCYHEEKKYYSSPFNGCYDNARHGMQQ